VRSFFDWIAAEALQNSEWLVIGKGPSYKKLSELAIAPGTRTISLNHACRENAVDVAHIIDLDVLEHCGDELYANAKYLVLPLHPHVDNKPGKKNLNALIEERADLARFAREGRLLFYVSSTFVPDDYRGVVVKVSFFSGDAVISLLAAAGVRRICTIGVDGGSSYSSRFEDLNTQTLLANGRQSFDDQSSAIG
jgi:hypothetical protein